MRRKDLEIREFARLQGAEETKGWVKWGEIFALSLFLAGCVLLVTHNLYAATEPFELAPYTGMIKNSTRADISVPSGNSDATLVIPPGGWMEHTVWKPEFTMTAYVNGQPYSCQKVVVARHSFVRQCVEYDFLAEVLPQEQPKAKKHYRKKPRLKGGVEAYG